MSFVHFKTGICTFPVAAPTSQRFIKLTALEGGEALHLGALHLTDLHNFLLLLLNVFHAVLSLNYFLRQLRGVQSTKLSPPVDVFNLVLFTQLNQFFLKLNRRSYFIFKFLRSLLTFLPLLGQLLMLVA